MRGVMMMMMTMMTMTMVAFRVFVGSGVVRVA